MKDVFKVTITADQVKELDQLTNANHHTEAMKKLTAMVCIALIQKQNRSGDFGTATMDLYIEEAESRHELMSTIEHLHNKFNRLSDTCNDVRYELMNKTLECIKNETEVRGCL